MFSMETKRLPRHIPSGLESHLGYWLRRVSNAVSGEFTRKLQAQQTSVAEWVLSRELYDRGEATPGDLAKILGMTRGAISKVVDKLEEKMWVIQAQTEGGDSRVRILSLTREGRRNVPLLAKVADENDAHFFDCLDADEKRTLQKMLSKIADRQNIHDIPIT